MLICCRHQLNNEKVSLLNFSFFKKWTVTKAVNVNKSMVTKSLKTYFVYNSWEISGREKRFPVQRKSLLCSGNLSSVSESAYGSSPTTSIGGLSTILEGSCSLIHITACIKRKLRYLFSKITNLVLPCYSQMNRLIGCFN